MNGVIVIPNNCESCGCELVEPVNFCGNCGVSVVRADDPGGIRLSGPESRQVAANAPGLLVIAPVNQRSVVDDALNNRLIVMAIVLVAGPIGLPALWFSPRFSRGTKIITTGVYFLLTAVLPLLVAWYFLDVALRPLVNVFGG